MAVAEPTAPRPALSVVMPTFNNETVLRRAVEGWRRFGGDAIELIVVEDGCKDGTAAYLERERETPWGRAHLRWVHEDDAHELRCTNRGFTEATGDLVAAWQDDMFLQEPWFVPEIVATFAAYPDLGLLSLSRGLQCVPCDDPIERWEDLWDWRRLQSTIGHGPANWIRLQEVDAVIRPWIVRRECIMKVGMLDEAFRPTEWDEADLAFRIREAGWKVAACGYERLGAYWEPEVVALACHDVLRTAGDERAAEWLTRAYDWMMAVANTIPDVARRQAHLQLTEPRRRIAQAWRSARG